MRGSCQGCPKTRVKLKKVFSGVLLCRKCRRNAPSWCLVYRKAGDQEMISIPRAEIENLPRHIQGTHVNVCGRAWWEARAQIALPEDDIVAVRRMAPGRFEYYSIIPTEPS